MPGLPDPQLVAGRPLSELLNNPQAPPPDPVPDLVRTLNAALRAAQTFLDGNVHSYASILLPGVNECPFRPLTGDINEHALLHACYLAPDDDAPRLAYADWLQERGHEPVADYIRIACGAAGSAGHQRRELAATQSLTFWQDRFDELHVRCRLSIADTPAVPGGLQEPVPPRTYRREFVRGLPTRVIIRGRLLLDLFHTRREASALWLANEARVPCNPHEGINLGMCGNMAAKVRATMLARLLKEHLAQSKWTAPCTRIDVFR